MIKIYFDWNIFSYIKKEEYKELRKKIEELKPQLLFPFSASHFKDLSKSYSPTNDFFEKDIKTLENLTQDAFLSLNSNKVSLREYNPREFFEKNKAGLLKDVSVDLEESMKVLDGLSIDGLPSNLGSILENVFKSLPANLPINEDSKKALSKLLPNVDENSSFWDVMKDITSTSDLMIKDKNKYLEVRDHIGDSGFKLPSHSGAWKIEDVIKNIDSFLKEKNTNLNFLEYVKLGFQNKEPSDFELFTKAYAHLDIIGFKSDKLPKPTDTLLNITTDSEHAFLATHCDYFVVNDKKLRIKAQVLFSEFGVRTKVLTYNEFEELVNHTIETKPKNFNDFLNQAQSFTKEEKLEEKILASNNQEFDTFAYNVEPLFLNYFNAVIKQNQKENTLLLVFRKVYQHKGFTHPNEIEYLLKYLVEILGFPLDYINYKSKKETLINENENVFLIWYFRPVSLILSRDENLNRVELQVIIKNKTV